MSDLNVYSTTAAVNALTPVDGDMVVDTEANAVKVYCNSAWKVFNNDAAPGFENRWGASFDGADDRLLTSNTPIMFNDMANGYTFSCWSYRDDDPNVASNGGTTNWFGGPLASAEGSHSFPYLKWYLIDEYWNSSADNMIRWYHGSQTISNQSIVVPKDSWFHLAATWDGASTATMYLNGNQIGQRTDASTLNTALTHKMMVGKGHFSNQGKIDEVAYFNTCLSAPDILKIHNGTAPGSTDGVPTDLRSAASYDTDRTSSLKVYYRMGDDSNDSPVAGQPINAGITDSSGNGNDATQGSATSQPTFSDLTGETIYV